MQRKIVAIIFCVLYVSVGISADDDIKRGTFQFLGFIYYQDESVVDSTGARFRQNGILIRPNYLITASLVSSISEEPLSKTLLARFGAVRIDGNFTLNEDEDEQEQEVIQVITPHQHDPAKWWATDISLLKTLQPFKKTTTVHITQLSTKRDYTDKICNILVFKKKGSSEERFLTHLAVEMLQPSKENCGKEFEESTMTCANDPQMVIGQEKTSESDFCQGNSGGPLICENDVMALQTYVNGICYPPHLYQLLVPWRTFLACGTEDKCDNVEKCPLVCSVTSKDAPTPKENTTMTAASTSTTTEVSTSKTEEEEEGDDKSNEVTPTPSMSSEVTEKTKESTVEIVTTTNHTTETVAVEQPSTTEMMTTSWPNERNTLKLDHDEGDLKVEKMRDTNIEAQQHNKMHKIVYDNKAEKPLVIQNLIYSIFLGWIYLF